MRGHQYRISDFAAAVLMAQLTRLDELCARREKHAAYLQDELKNIPGLLPQENYPHCNRRNYYVFGLRYDEVRDRQCSARRFAVGLKPRPSGRLVKTSDCGENSGLLHWRPRPTCTKGRCGLVP